MELLGGGEAAELEPGTSREDAVDAAVDAPEVLINDVGAARKSREWAGSLEEGG